MSPQLVLILIPLILLSLTVHEYAHGYIAWHYGDNTAKDLGRLSFNPLSHLDFMGTLTFVLTLQLFGFPFGWAKPVPINPMELANPRRDMVWVALAGPASNILLAVLISAIFQIIHLFTPLPDLLFPIIILAIQINLSLAIFNLLPIAPLDGEKIVTGLLSVENAMKFRYYSRYLPKIFFGLIIIGMITNTSPLSYLLTPIWTPWFTFWGKLLIAPLY